MRRDVAKPRTSQGNESKGSTDRSEFESVLITCDGVAKVGLDPVAFQEPMCAGPQRRTGEHRALLSSWCAASRRLGDKGLVCRCPPCRMAKTGVVSRCSLPCVLWVRLGGVVSGR